MNAWEYSIHYSITEGKREQNEVFEVFEVGEFTFVLWIKEEQHFRVDWWRSMDIISSHGSAINKIPIWKSCIIVKKLQIQTFAMKTKVG